MQITLFDSIAIDKPECTDSSAGQICGSRTSQTAYTNDKYFAVLESELTCSTDQ
jgi:hypothetical protein